MVVNVLVDSFLLKKLKEECILYARIILKMKEEENMKKILITCMAVAGISTAFAATSFAENEVTVNFSKTDNTATVTLDSTFESSLTDQVTIMVADSEKAVSDETITYINQGTLTEVKALSPLKLKSDLSVGTHTVYVGGTDVTTPKSATFINPANVGTVQQKSSDRIWYTLVELADASKTTFDIKLGDTTKNYKLPTGINAPAKFYASFDFTDESTITSATKCNVTIKTEGAVDVAIPEFEVSPASASSN